MNKEELKEMFGEDFADKIHKTRCVFLYYMDVLPRQTYSCGYGWEEVGRVQTLENEDRAMRMDTAMKAAISIVFDKPYDSAQKVVDKIREIVLEEKE